MVFGSGGENTCCLFGGGCGMAKACKWEKAAAGERFPRCQRKNCAPNRDFNSLQTVPSNLPAGLSAADLLKRTQTGNGVVGGWGGYRDNERVMEWKNR